VLEIGNVTGQKFTVEGMPGRYATALFELADEAKALDAVAGDLDSIQALLEESADLTRLVLSPVFSADDQMRAIAVVLERAGIGGLAANFINLVARNRRLFAVQEMISAYRQLLAAARGEIAAEVTSAHALNDKQVKALKTSLKAVVGRDVLLESSVDPALLGGLIVKVGSRMIDSSLRTKLNNLKIAMKEVG
jgi:F-type H+-transporting ATPase subunit delta